MMLLVRVSTENRSETSGPPSPPGADKLLKELLLLPPPPRRAGLLQAEQLLQHVHQALRVAVDDREHLDLRRRRRHLIELSDQGRDQVHALGRRRDKQRVARRIGRDPHVGEDARRSSRRPWASSVKNCSIVERVCCWPARRAVLAAALLPLLLLELLELLPPPPCLLLPCAIWACPVMALCSTGASSSASELRNVNTRSSLTARWWARRSS